MTPDTRSLPVADPDADRALRDEVECRTHFGADYADYMQRSKRFIPFVF